MGQLIAVVAFFGATFLLIALVAMGKMAIQPVPATISGRPVKDSPVIRAATLSLIIALVISFVGAALAIVDWVMRIMSVAS
jgi:hypothetical protein